MSKSEFDVYKENEGWNEIEEDEEEKYPLTCGMEIFQL